MSEQVKRKLFVPPERFTHRGFGSMWRKSIFSAVVVASIVITSLSIISSPVRADWIPYATLAVSPSQVYIDVDTTFTYTLYNGRGSAIDIQDVSVHFDWQTSGWVYYLISSTVTLPSYSSHDFVLLIQIPQVPTGEHIQTVNMKGQAVGDWSSSTLTQDDIFMVSEIPPLPNITLTATPSSGTAPLQVAFTASASGGMPPYQSYSWNFDDGQPTVTTENVATHTYVSAGTFTALVMVTDSYPHVNTGQTMVTVYTQLSVVASADKTIGEASLTVHFTGSATGGVPPYSYSWVFGDRGTSSEASPTYVYTSAGTYMARLTVTDSRSTTQTYEVTITVSQKVGLSNSQVYAVVGILAVVIAIVVLVLAFERNKAGKRPPNQ